MKTYNQLRKIRLFFNSPEKIALTLALVFGILSAVLVPQMTVNDEGAHLLKSYSLTNGQFAGKTCEFPKDILDKKNSESSKPGLENINGDFDYSNTKTTTCGSAGNYSPIMHLPQSIGVGIGRILNTSPDMLVLFGRLANVLFYAFALYLIVRFAKIGKWAYVVIGLFPLMIHTAGSLSGDVMNNIIVMASLMYIFNLFVQKHLLSKRQVAILILIAVLFAVTKSTNVIFLLILTALPARLFNSNKKIKLPFNIIKWAILGLCALVAIGTILFSQQLLGSALFFRETVTNPLESNPLRFFYILYNTYLNPALGYGDLLLRGIFGEFSSFKYHLPSGLIVIEILLLIFVLFHKPSQDSTINKKELGPLAAVCSAALVILVLAITFALYSAWAIQPDRLGAGAIYADGVQGRYFTAALLALIPVAVYLRQFVWIKTKSNTIIGTVVSLSATFILTFYILETLLIFT